MRNIIFFILLFLIACKEPNPNTIQFENPTYSTCNIPIVKLKIGDTTANFIIDSGANTSLIDEDFYSTHSDLFQFADRIDINQIGINGSKDYKNREIVIANTDLGNITFITQDLTAVMKGVKGYNIVGIIGSSHFELYPTIIDYYNRCIYFQKISLNLCSFQ